MGAVCWEGECSSVTWRALLISDTGYSPLPWCQELGKRALWGQSRARSARYRQGRSQRFLWYKPQPLEMQNKSKRRNQDSWGRKHAHTLHIYCSTSGTSPEQASSSYLATPGRPASQPELRAFSLCWTDLGSSLCAATLLTSCVTRQVPVLSLSLHL